MHAKSALVTHHEICRQFDNLKIFGVLKLTKHRDLRIQLFGCTYAVYKPCPQNRKSHFRLFFSFFSFLGGSIGPGGPVVRSQPAAKVIRFLSSSKTDSFATFQDNSKMFL